MEAALCLSLLLFFMVTLTMPLKMINTQRKIQAVLESAGEEFSQYGYIQYKINKGEASVEESDQWSREMLRYLANTAFQAYLEKKIQEITTPDELSALSLKGSKLLEDEETIYLEASYELVLPFPIFRISGIPGKSICRRRAWIGREGGRRGSEGGEEKDETVYIGRNPTRYHRSRECHYLFNNIQAVDYDSVSGIVNQEGRHYSPCAVCGKKAGGRSTVYVMKGGTHYHSDRYCSSIVSYVEAVPLSTVKELGECAYCGKKEES